ncbi:M15 family metallopeptidase [Mesorhizobium sp. CAU 1741]|uniref:M15 family metallopeptidase n=1 Tax=Mesorhizobium sp. CAU 1741 TaxID=3140366 RepID=UPI00325B14B6
MSFAEWLQSRLTAHGYSPGPIDGVIGPGTIAAIRAFEKANGLPVDGTADERLVKALRASASAVRPAQMAAIPDRARDLGEGMLPTQSQWPRQAGVPGFFGAVGTDQVQIDVPFDMVLAWDKSTRLRRMTLHRKVAASALRALTRVAETYSPAERAALGLNLFGGSLNVRRMRGGSAYSMHSWGIAIDFDPERNQLSWKAPQARLSHTDAVPFWKAWEEEGWLSLGRARNFDWMHVQAARL